MVPSKFIDIGRATFSKAKFNRIVDSIDSIPRVLALLQNQRRKDPIVNYGSSLRVALRVSKRCFC